MSPILDIQRQLVELGRIRTGDQVEFQDGQGRTKLRPRKLETFRITSPRRDLVEEAARLYGGEVRPWGEQWEVVIAADTLPIMLPPGQALSQWHELWSGGGCQRRCDGERQVLVDEPCACPADKAERAELAKTGAACKPTTRVNLILPELPGLGVFRLESHGYYAAVELAGAAEYLSMATSVGHRVPAHLRVVKRTVKRPGKDGKPQTRNFTVPTIDIDIRPADLLAGRYAEIAPTPVAPALPSGPVNRRERVPRPMSPPVAALPAEAGLERESRPPLPEPPAIDEPPFAPPPAAAAGPEPEWFASAPEPAPAEHRLVVALRAKAASSGLVGPRTAPQKTQLQAIFTPLGQKAAETGLRTVFGLAALSEITAAQAQALIETAVDATFGELWTEMVATSDRGSAVEQIA